MLLDKGQVLELIKLPMSAADRARTSSIDLALTAALDEYTLRVRSTGSLRSYTQTVGSGTRTVTLRGDNDDLVSIFAIKYGTGENETTMAYRPPKSFLADHDNPSQSGGVPSVYTILKGDEGFPQIKFNCPTSSSDTLTVYYFPGITPGNLSIQRMSTAIVALAQGYFYGIATDIGALYYRAGRELTTLARAADSFVPTEVLEQPISRQDRETMSVQSSIRGNRT